ncbi:hypothetical protein KCU89_g62, partial [Aureobasidium melanogenum]
MSSNGYVCVSGVPVSPGAEQTSTLGLKSTQSYKQILDSPLCTPCVQEKPTTSITSSQSAPILVPQAWQPSQDSYGIRFYTSEGKLASVYDADSNSVFRCDDLTYPSNGYYVAFYTPYNSTLAIEGKSQPAPAKCGQYVDFKNPLTGVSATALVLDRCASCIGVGGQLNDPSTDQSLVNGATVDFSRALWNKIYNNAPNNVYDVQYAGKPNAQYAWPRILLLIAKVLGLNIVDTVAFVLAACISFMTTVRPLFPSVSKNICKYLNTLTS